MDYDYKLVRFDLYCKDCKYRKLNENEEPCNECLTHAVNLHSRKPVNFIFDENKKKGLTFDRIKRFTFSKLKKLTFGRLKGDD